MVVYDVAGRIVRTLVDDVKDPGEYNAVWDGRNDQHEALASGGYFIRLNAGTHMFWRKAALLR
jgi:hypothetical protein